MHSAGARGPEHGELRGAPKFEVVGVETIADEDRVSTPWTFFVILVGGSMSLAYAIYGWIAVTFGLGFWSAISAVVFGTLVGMVLVAPLAVIGSSAATNNATASGAFFGVRGRLVGSAIGLLIALVFSALSIWTGGDAIVSVADRLFGTPNTDAARALAYGFVALLVVAIALWGYHLLARASALILIVGALVFVLMIIAFAGDLTTSYKGGEYLLGDFGKTWILCAVTVGVSGPLALITIMGDWSRYISPERHPPMKFLPIAMLGIFVSLMIPTLLGIAIAVTFEDPFADFVPALVDASPTWFVVALLPLATLGSLGVAAQTMYSSGLDLEAMLPRVSRLASTVAASVVSVALVYLGAFAFDVQESIVAISLILVVIGAPWAAVTAIGYLRCRGQFREEDLQVFNRGQTGGVYWFRAGWNWRAVVAFLSGATFGLLAANTTLYTGPWADLANGVDVSFVGSGTISAVVYLVLIAIFREPAIADGDQQPIEGAARVRADSAAAA